jgi:hypothetical protein
MMFVEHKTKRNQAGKKRTKLSNLLAAPLTLAATIAASIPAQALTFNMTYAPGTTSNQILGFEMAAGIWSQYLTDNAETINLHIEMSNQGLGTGELGGATPALISNQAYNPFLYRLGVDSTSLFDATAVTNLAYNSLINNNSYKYIIDSTTYTNNQLIITRANAKALGINTNSHYGGLDGYIQINPNQNWNYNYLNTPTTGQYDFLSIAIHEIGHALGFISSIDQPNITSIKTATPLDLFRYSTSKKSAGLIDLSVGGTPFFSLDGKTCTQINRVCPYFATVTDGEQASHWKNSTTPLGIMTPNLSAAARINISQIDLLALDAIGYNVNTNAAINLSTIQQQAAQKAQTALISNRAADVAAMKSDSIVYNWGWNGFWQGTEANSTNPQQVPEAPSTLGILGIALLGIRSLLKNLGKQ